jgi:hypothetical protein
VEPHPPGEQPDQHRSPQVEDAAAPAPAQILSLPEPTGGRGAEPGRGDELLAELRAVRHELAAAEAVHAARWQQLAAALDVTEPGLAALRVDLADALEAVRDRLVATVETASGATTGALETTTSAVTEVVHGLRDVLLDRVEEHQSLMRARLADVTAQVQAGGAATRATQERLAALTTATEQLQRTVLTLQGEWDARVDRASERLVQAAGEAAEAVGARLAEQLLTAGDPRHSSGEPLAAAEAQAPQRRRRRRQGSPSRTRRSR